MIIKKPYAFLIKHFRSIHLILSALVLYLLIKTHNIFKFFNDYANQGFYNYTENLTSSHINFYMFICSLLIILAALFIYLLMKWKKKSRTFYITFIVFYFLLFISYLIYFNAFNNLVNTTLNVRTIRAYRDIILLLYVPQYIFLVISVIRAIGFDIKKFDFKKDLEELDIAEEDQEEIEVTLGDNSYKVKRWLRKTIRELKYYIVENKFFFAVICSVIVLVIGFLIYLNITVYSKTYQETDRFNINGLTFNVLSSYITDVDYNGNQFENKRYIIVKTEIENTNTVRSYLETDKLFLVVDGVRYYPNYSLNESFVDLGEGFTENKILYAGEKNEYLFIFAVANDLVFNKATLRLNEGVDTIKGEIKSRYKEVLLDIKELFYTDLSNKYKTKEGVSLKNSTLNNSEIIINNSYINDTFTENFSYVVNGKKYTGTKTIKPDVIGKGSRTIMKINMEYVLDEDLYINKFIKTNSDFIKYFGKITYNYDGVVKTYKPVIKDFGNVKFKDVFIEVPSEVKNSTSIKLEICIRNEKYLINL